MQGEVVVDKRMEEQADLEKSLGFSVKMVSDRYRLALSLRMLG